MAWKDWPAHYSLRTCQIIHPDAWRRRRLALPGREPALLAAPNRGALEGAGFEIVEQSQPSFLLGGSLLDSARVFEQVRHLATSDPLTGLANYRRLLDVLDT